ncbi:MAG: hypothetical protein HYT80_07670, partial [Euryarchaeota archaeon]|nr:hypothetical protein [Euryarchaeota archaeon]
MGAATVPDQGPPPAAEGTSDPPDWGPRDRAARLLLIAGLVASATPFVSPPVALLAGLLLALSVGNPFEKATSRFSKHLLRVSVVGLGFGIPLGAVIEAGRAGLVEVTVGVLAVSALGIAVGAI